jgi:DNA-binding MarR family transcriptional regulator
MANKAMDSRDLYEHVSQLSTELTTMRAWNVRHHHLDLDNFLILEAFATASCCSEADLVRTFGRNASFYSRAVDLLVKRRWLRKRMKARRDIRFEVKITAKGQRVYHEIQASFFEQLRQKLGLSPMKAQAMRSMCDKLMEFNQILRGDKKRCAGST